MSLFTGWLLRTELNGPESLPGDLVSTFVFECGMKSKLGDRCLFFFVFCQSHEPTLGVHLQCLDEEEWVVGVCSGIVIRIYVFKELLSEQRVQCPQAGWVVLCILVIFIKPGDLFQVLCKILILAVRAFFDFVNLREVFSAFTVDKLESFVS